MIHTYKYLVVILVATIISACYNKSPEVDPETNELKSSMIVIDQSQFDSSKFELGRIEQQSFTKVLNAVGSLKIPEKSTAVVTTLMSGKVGTIDLIEGQWVKRGQRLFTITNPELINLQEEFIIANGQLEYLREEYKRQIELSKEKLSTQKDFLKAKSELTTIQARQGSLGKKLKLYGISTDNLNTNNLVSSLSVVAPISGYITHIEALQGMYLEPNQSAITLANTSQIFLEISVLEKDISQLEEGQNLTFTLQSDPSVKYDATTYLISKSINDNNMISVNCTLKSDTKHMLPGMYVNAEIGINTYTTNALPVEAVVKNGDIHYILSLKEKENNTLQFEKNPIQTGVLQNGYIELVNVSDSNSEYLTKGAYFLVQ